MISRRFCFAVLVGIGLLLPCAAAEKLFSIDFPRSMYFESAYLSSGVYTEPVAKQYAVLRTDLGDYGVQVGK